MKIVFAARLKELRLEQNLTQSELAEKLLMTQRKISYLESAKIEPNLYDLWKISDFFKVSIDYLVGKVD